jgi:poly-gamma-glutamate synthesis protein (capsule biosynthesis protein)
VTDRGEPWPGKGIHYRMHPANVGCLTAAGIDCCVLANNHVLDWSYPGLSQTVASLGAAGIAVAGAGVDAADAEAPAAIDAGSGRRVVVLGLGAVSSGIPASWRAAPGRGGVAVFELNSADVEAVAARVSSVVEPGDLVVASIHWGSNWGYRIPSVHRRFARALIDEAGVDVVHGHSSHHPLAIEVHGGRPILDGCGDLINDYEGIEGHQRYHPDLGLVYLMTMDPDGGGLERLEMAPLRRHRFRLVRATEGEQAWLAETLTREGASLGTGVEVAGEDRLALRW